MARLARGQPRQPSHPHLKIGHHQHEKRKIRLVYGRSPEFGSTYLGATQRDAQLASPQPRPRTTHKAGARRAMHRAPAPQFRELGVVRLLPDEVPLLLDLFTVRIKRNIRAITQQQRRNERNDEHTSNVERDR